MDCLIINFDTFSEFELPLLRICAANDNIICNVQCPTEFTGSFNHFDISEISFRVDYETNKETYDQYAVRREILMGSHPSEILPEHEDDISPDNGFFIITENTETCNEEERYRTIVAKSCEYELSNILMPYVGKDDGYFGSHPLYREMDLTENRSDVIPPSYMYLVWKHAPGWSFGYVDQRYKSADSNDYVSASIADTTRLLESSDSDTIYGFMTTKIAEAFECVFLFDNLRRKIIIKSREGSISDSDIVLSQNSLVNSITIKESEEDRINCLTVASSNGVNLGYVNPIGGNILYHFSDYDYTLMSDTLEEHMRVWSSRFENHIKNAYLTGGSDSSDYSRWGYIALHKKLNTLNAEKVLKQSEYNDSVSKKNNVASNLSTANSQVSLSGNKDLENQRDQYEAQLKTLNDNLESIKSEINNIDGFIAPIEARIKEIADSLEFYNFLKAETYKKYGTTDAGIRLATAELESCYSELIRLIRTYSYSNDSIVINEAVYQIEDLEQRYDRITDIVKMLYDDAYKILKRTSEPRSDITIDSQNFYFIKDFEHISKQLQTGNGVWIEKPNGQVQKHSLLKIDVDYSNKEFSITLSNRYRINDPLSIFEDSYGNSSSIANITVENYMALEQQKEQISTLMALRGESLNVTKQNVLSADNQEIVVDDGGMRFRTFELDENGNKIYDPTEMMMANGTILFTNDGWSNAKLAVGRYYDTVTNSWRMGINGESIIAHTIAADSIDIGGMDYNYSSNLVRDGSFDSMADTDINNRSSMDESIINAWEICDNIYTSNDTDSKINQNDEILVQNDVSVEPVSITADTLTIKSGNSAIISKKGVITTRNKYAINYGKLNSTISGSIFVKGDATIEYAIVDAKSKNVLKNATLKHIRSISHDVYSRFFIFTLKDDLPDYTGYGLDIYIIAYPSSGCDSVSLFGLYVNDDDSNIDYDSYYLFPADDVFRKTNLINDKCDVNYSGTFKSYPEYHWHLYEANDSNTLIDTEANSLFTFDKDVDGGITLHSKSSLLLSNTPFLMDLSKTYELCVEVAVPQGEDAIVNVMLIDSHANELLRLDEKNGFSDIPRNLFMEGKEVDGATAIGNVYKHISTGFLNYNNSCDKTAFTLNSEDILLDDQYNPYEIAYGKGTVHDYYGDDVYIAVIVSSSCEGAVLKRISIYESDEIELSDERCSNFVEDNIILEATLNSNIVDFSSLKVLNYSHYTPILKGGFDNGSYIMITPNVVAKVRFKYNGINVFEDIKVFEGLPYCISGYIKGAGKIMIRWQTNTVGSIDPFIIDTENNLVDEDMSGQRTEWRRISAKLTAPEGAKSVDIILIPVSYPCCFDGILLEQSTSLNAYTSNVKESYCSYTHIDDNGISVYGGKLRIYNNNNNLVFHADENGNLEIKGRLTAENGSNIAGWTISDNQLRSANVNGSGVRAIIDATDGTFTSLPQKDDTNIDNNNYSTVIRNGVISLADYNKNEVGSLRANSYDDSSFQQRNDVVLSAKKNIVLTHTDKDSGLEKASMSIGSDISFYVPVANKTLYIDGAAYATNGWRNYYQLVHEGELDQKIEDLTEKINTVIEALKTGINSEIERLDNRINSIPEGGNQNSNGVTTDPIENNGGINGGGTVVITDKQWKELFDMMAAVISSNGLGSSVRPIYDSGYCSYCYNLASRYRITKKETDKYQFFTYYSYEDKTNRATAYSKWLTEC